MHNQLVREIYGFVRKFEFSLANKGLFVVQKIKTQILYEEKSVHINRWFNAKRRLRTLEYRKLLQVKDFPNHSAKYFFNLLYQDKFSIIKMINERLTICVRFCSDFKTNNAKTAQSRF